MAQKFSDRGQSQRFIKAAQELGCDEDPAHFDEILKKVARHKPAKASTPRKKLAADNNK
jgi:hypothetical protein